MRIFLIRHGYSQGNENGDNYARLGDPNIQLTDTGWQQAIAAGRFLKDYFARNNITDDCDPCLWMSPYERSRETASGIAHGAQGLFKAPPRVEEALIEMDFGDFSSLHSEELRKKEMPLVSEFYDRARAFGKFYARPPRGESPFDVQRRVKPFIDTLWRDQAQGVDNHVCVTHGVTLRVLAMAFMHIDPKRYDEFPNPPNCGIYVIEGDRKSGYTFKQIYDGETGQEVDINWGEKLKAGQAIVPPVPERFRNIPH